MSHLLNVEHETTFQCGNGGVVRLIGFDKGSTISSQFGCGEEYCYFDDLHINAYNDLVVSVEGEYNTEASVQHLTGDSILRFSLSSLEPNGKADLKITGLQDYSWYRLRLGGKLASSGDSRAHGETDGNGMLVFNEVKIPNE